ncbi:MAG: hypothetical protein ACK4VN_07775 [Bacteroidales bacterium]
MLKITDGEITESEKAFLIPLSSPAQLAGKNYNQSKPTSKPEHKHILFGKTWENLADNEKALLKKEHPKVYKLKFADFYGFEPKNI